MCRRACLCSRAWAPLGSAVPEDCPASGFYCPGAAADTINDPPGSKAIIIPVGDSTTTETEEVEVVTQEMTLDVTCDSFDIEAVKQALALQYGVDPSLITIADPCATRRRKLQTSGLTLTIEIRAPDPPPPSPPAPPAPPGGAPPPPACAAGPQSREHRLSRRRR